MVNGILWVIPEIGPKCVHDVNDISFYRRGVGWRWVGRWIIRIHTTTRHGMLMFVLLALQTNPLRLLSLAAKAFYSSPTQDSHHQFIGYSCAALHLSSTATTTCPERILWPSSRRTSIRTFIVLQRNSKRPSSTIHLYDYPAALPLDCTGIQPASRGWSDGKRIFDWSVQKERNTTNHSERPVRLPKYWEREKKGHSIQIQAQSVGSMLLMTQKRITMVVFIVVIVADHVLHLFSSSGQDLYFFSVPSLRSSTFSN